MNNKEGRTAKRRIKLKVIPSISEPERIKSLDYSHNLIQEIPSELRQAINLQSIDISYNNIANMEILTYIVSLKRISAKSNLIFEVPPEITQLSQLRHLDLRDNKIRFLNDAQSIKSLFQLRKGFLDFLIEGNLCLTVPQAYEVVESWKVLSIESFKPEQKCLQEFVETQRKGMESTKLKELAECATSPIISKTTETKKQTSTEGKNEKELEQINVNSEIHTEEKVTQINKLPNVSPFIIEECKSKEQQLEEMLLSASPERKYCQMCQVRIKELEEIMSREEEYKLEIEKLKEKHLEENNKLKEETDVLLKKIEHFEKEAENWEELSKKQEIVVEEINKKITPSTYQCILLQQAKTIEQMLSDCFQTNNFKPPFYPSIEETEPNIKSYEKNNSSKNNFNSKESNRYFNSNKCNIILNSTKQKMEKSTPLEYIVEQEIKKIFTQENNNYCHSLNRNDKNNTSNNKNKSHSGIKVNNKIETILNKESERKKSKSTTKYLQSNKIVRNKNEGENGIHISAFCAENKENLDNEQNQFVEPVESKTYRHYREHHLRNSIAKLLKQSHISNFNPCLFSAKFIRK